MNRLDRPPSAFQRYRQVGGVVEFGVFEQANGTQDEALDAIGQLLEPDGAFDRDRLCALGGRSLDKHALLGDWYDPLSKSLILRGEWRTDAGVTLHDPPLESLDAVRIVSGGAPVPIAGGGGQFAYAFSNPPYRLDARPSEVQQLFDAACDFIMPAGTHHDIRDWSDPRLVDVSPVFRAGMEWWGVFLFTIHVPALRRLTVALASTTD